MYIYFCLQTEHSRYGAESEIATYVNPAALVVPKTIVHRDQRWVNAGFVYLGEQAEKFWVEIKNESGDLVEVAGKRDGRLAFPWTQSKLASAAPPWRNQSQEKLRAGVKILRDAPQDSE